MISLDAIQAMFNAKCTAVVGASASADKTGHTILKNIIDGGYQGHLYPINPKSESILGIPCCPSLLDVPEDIDLVVVVVPAKAVPEVMRQAAKKNAKGAIIVSGGFRETGHTALEAEVMGIANENNMAVIGPNCQGMNYTPNHLCASWPLVTTQGSMAVVSQSGTIGAAMEGWAEDDGIGITAMVALGNKSGIGEVELMRYFTLDDATKVIALNIEGVSDGPEFIRAACDALKKKPVVLLKPGRTAKGAEAAQSHTKSIAGNDAVFDAVCRQFGIIRAEGITEFYDYCKILGMLDKPAGRRVMIVTSSGGSGILAADICEDLQLELVRLDEDIATRLTSSLPEQCVVANPLDLTGDATAERYQTAMDVAVEAENVDTYLLIFGDPIENVCETVDNLKKKTNKPVLVAYLGGGQVEKEEAKKMHARGIPVFQTPERAVRALGALVRKQ